MGSVQAREGQWYLDRSSREMFCVITVDESEGLIGIRDRYGDIDEFDRDEWDAMDLEPCPAPRSAAAAQQAPRAGNAERGPRR